MIGDEEPAPDPRPAGRPSEPTRHDAKPGQQSRARAIAGARRWPAVEMTPQKLAQAKATRAENKSLQHIAGVLSVGKTTVARALAKADETSVS